MPIKEHTNMLYGSAWMQSAVASRIAEEAQDTDPLRELQGYLASPLELFSNLADTAIISWWRDHSVIYPTLGRMA